VCTGHYARIEDGVLYWAADLGKDQSYVLAVLTSEQLSHALFPLGDAPKAQVRAEAADRGLAVADKPDSHDVCFIADGDTKAFLARRLGQAPGQIVDQSGAVLGEHDGAYAFTVGQRRGLRVGTPAEDDKPRYVLDIEPVTRTVTVGPPRNWTSSRSPPPARSGPAAPRQRSPSIAWSNSAPTARSTPARLAVQRRASPPPAPSPPAA
jgi:tRNA-uridine 2-sulfurtransferase